MSDAFRIRLAEGFNFAYSAAGIINMVLEIQMKGRDNDDTSDPCIIQYIIFPPHIVPNVNFDRENGSDEDTDEGK